MVGVGDGQYGIPFFNCRYVGLPFGVCVMKICSKCKVNKPLCEFNKNKQHKDGLHSYCKNCYKTINAEYKLKKAYGVTSQQKEKLITAQAGKCAICNTKLDNPKFTNVDHCHNTGKIRGILCHHCNFGLGQFKDNVELLESAIKYLKENDAS